MIGGIDMPKPKYGRWITKQGLALINGWAKSGLTEEQIAHNMGVSRSTLSKYKNELPDILNALKTGKEVADFEVENALYQRALGSETIEVVEEYDEDGNLKGSKKTFKAVQGDTTAMIFWLKNRKPDEWRDKRFQEVNAEVKGEIANPFEGMSKQELRKMLRDE